MIVGTRPEWVTYRCDEPVCGREITVTRGPGLPSTWQVRHSRPHGGKTIHRCPDHARKDGL